MKTLNFSIKLNKLQGNPTNKWSVRRVEKIHNINKYLNIKKWSTTLENEIHPGTLLVTKVFNEIHPGTLSRDNSLY